MTTKDEFYIGWENQAPAATAKFLKFVGGAIGIVGLVLGCLLALAQQTIGRSVFEWGKVKQFSGTFVSHPYTHLVSPTNTYYLVAPFKHGLDPSLAEKLDRQNVTLQGTLIYRDNLQMIEVIPESIKPTSRAANAIPQIALGRQTLVGEIVDSKCYFGVMNPGQFIPHRACAIRCISGGVPPVLVVHRPNGETTCLLLTAADGRPLNEQILRLVAEPVQITGFVEQTDHLLTLRAESIKRL